MDRKTVMSWLEGLAADDWRMFYSDSEVSNTAKAALELLKEQEQKKCKNCKDYLDIHCSCYEIVKDENWFCADWRKKE